MICEVLGFRLNTSRERLRTIGEGFVGQWGGTPLRKPFHETSRPTANSLFAFNFR